MGTLGLVVFFSALKMFFLSNFPFPDQTFANSQLKLVHVKKNLHAGGMTSDEEQCVEFT